MVLIVPGRIMTGKWQKQYLVKDVKDGKNKLHISIIDQLGSTTIVVTLTPKMVVFGVIPRILTRNGNTVLKF